MKKNYIYQTIQENDYLDIYRITGGVILKVYKVKPIGGIYYHNWNKRKMEKLFKDCYKLRDKANICGYTLKAGTIILENCPVEQVEVKDYKYEIKTSGDAFGGRSDAVISYMNTINHLINKTSNPSQYEWENDNPEYIQGANSGNE